jgi:hypothetical protein
LIAQVAALLVTQFNSVNAFSNFGFSNVNVNDFQDFFGSLFSNFGNQFDSFDANDLAGLLALLQGLDSNGVVNSFGKQNSLFSNDFLSGFNVDNSFNSFSSNFNDILGGLNNVNFDANDLFNLIQLFEALGLNNANNINLNALNLSGVLNSSFGNNLNGLLNSNLNGFNSNINLNDLSNINNVNSLNSVDINSASLNSVDLNSASALSTAALS